MDSDQDVCRVCLSKADTTYVSLFQTYKNYCIAWYINSITNIDIEENDGLPENICVSCLNQLNVAISFKENCENSDVVLRNKDIKVEIEIKEEIQDDETDESQHEQMEVEEKKMSVEEANSTSAQTEIVDDEEREKQRKLEDLRQLKRACERKRRQRIKANPVLHEAHKEKERIRYAKRQHKKKTKPINELPPKEQNKQREAWRERKSRSRLRAQNKVTSDGTDDSTDSQSIFRAVEQKPIVIHGSEEMWKRIHSEMESKRSKRRTDKLENL